VSSRQQARADFKLVHSNHHGSPQSCAHQLLLDFTVYKWAAEWLNDGTHHYHTIMHVASESMIGLHNAQDSSVTECWNAVNMFV